MDSSGRSGEGAQGLPPPRPNVFHFHAVFEKSGQIVGWPYLGFGASPWAILDPPLGRLRSSQYENGRVLSQLSLCCNIFPCVFFINIHKGLISKGSFIKIKVQFLLYVEIPMLIFLKL